MYPRVFRPTTLCKINDDRGHEVDLCELQVFKPLLGCSFNGQQALIVNHKIPNMAGAIIRGLVRYPLPSALDIKPGPAYWASGLVPWIVLSEDPNALKWRWLDAVPWNLDAANKLWSFFAAVDYVPPPPPPPPTPITLGATSALATLVTPGVSYVATIPPTASGWAYSPQVTGTAYTIVAETGTSASMGSSPWGGNHLLIPGAEGSPVTGPGSASVPGFLHTGPDALGQFANPLLVGAPLVFKITVP